MYLGRSLKNGRNKLNEKIKMVRFHRFVVVF